MEIIDSTHTYIYVQAHGEREGEREEREGVYMCASVCAGMNVCLWVGEFRDLLRQPAASAGELEKGCSRPSGEKIDSRTYLTLYSGLPMRQAARAAILERILYIQACHVQLALHRQAIRSIYFLPVADSRGKIGR